MLEAAKLSVGFGGAPVIDNLCLTAEQGRILAILGPNGSGKSTLLKALSRTLKPAAGAVYLDGKNIRSFSAKSLACQLAILLQSPRAPGDLTVRDLVEYGRFPHQHWWRGDLEEDGRLVEWSLAQTRMADMADRLVATLSGGEQQRAWIAMALAQNPRVLLLDEPTTFLDVCHQLEILDLIVRLNRENGITVIMVLHDINHAARYADTVAVLLQGKVFAAGRPADVINAHMLRTVFRVEADIWLDGAGKPVCLARGLAAGE